MDRHPDVIETTAVEAVPTTPARRDLPARREPNPRGEVLNVPLDGVLRRTVREAVAHWHDHGPRHRSTTEAANVLKVLDAVEREASGIKRSIEDDLPVRRRP